jgi:Family of unknown function (DUF6152)
MRRTTTIGEEEDAMNRKTLVGWLVGAALVASVVPMSAHHSIVAEFDPNQPITFKGAIKKIEWTNPHIYTSVEVTGEGGKTIVYRVEGGPPNALFRQGWRKDSLKVGEVVSVSGIRAKSSTSMNVGQATITTSDGRKIFGTGGNRAASAQPEYKE